MTAARTAALALLAGAADSYDRRPWPIVAAAVIAAAWLVLLVWYVRRR